MLDVTSVSSLKSTKFLLNSFDDVTIRESRGIQGKTTLRRDIFKVYT